MADVDEHFDFERGTSGTSATYPMQCSALRPGKYVMLKGRPCKITEMSTSKTGKHGHAKVNLVAVDIFNDKKYEDTCPSTHSIDVPNVFKTEYTFLDVIEDKFVNVLDKNYEIKENLEVPKKPELVKELETRKASGEEFMVIVQSACGIEEIIGFKTPTN